MTEHHAIEDAVIEHYGHGNLMAAIEGGLEATGRSWDSLTVDDLAPVDEFHIGGRPATDRLLDKADFPGDGHILDVGCGLGGPARVAAGRVGMVSGIDLSEEYVAVGRLITSRMGLEGVVDLRAASALELPFSGGRFEGAYMMHVGMNIADKARLMTEVARVLKPGATFAVYDIMRIGPADLTFPLPWSSKPATSHVDEPIHYQEAATAAGFEVVAVNDRQLFAKKFFANLKRQNQDGGPPALGLHLVMGPDTPTKLTNMIAAVEADSVAPVELLLIRQ